MKTRLDVALFERGLSKSREEARALVMAGLVYLGETKAEKAGQFVTEETPITVRGETCPFVSRGGLKLQKAMQVFPIDLKDAVAADIGASTGGFTDCMLQNGARQVFAIDVGYGQLDWKLRSDDRVAVLERTNARFMEPAWFSEALDFASIDVSFISLDKILPALYPCLHEKGHVVALIKPQFEAGRDKVGKHGVVSLRLRAGVRDHPLQCRAAIGHAGLARLDVGLDDLVAALSRPPGDARGQKQGDG